MGDLAIDGSIRPIFKLFFRKGERWKFELISFETRHRPVVVGSCEVLGSVKCWNC